MTLLKKEFNPICVCLPISVLDNSGNGGRKGIPSPQNGKTVCAPGSGSLARPSHSFLRPQQDTKRPRLCLLALAGTAASAVGRRPGRGRQRLKLGCLLRKHCRRLAAFNTVGPLGGWWAALEPRSAQPLKGLSARPGVSPDLDHLPRSPKSPILDDTGPRGPGSRWNCRPPVPMTQKRVKEPESMV